MIISNLNHDVDRTPFTVKLRAVKLAHSNFQKKPQPKYMMRDCRFLNAAARHIQLLWCAALLPATGYASAWPTTDFESGVTITMSDIAVAVEFSDKHFYDVHKVRKDEYTSLAAAACRGWINYFPKIAIYTDSLTALPPGSAAERACGSHVVVARCCGAANATLNSSIATAQYKRESILVDFAQRFRGTRWRVSTEQDAWWNRGRLLAYLERIEQQLYKVGNLGWQPWIIAGAGSGKRLRKNETASPEMASLHSGVYGPFVIFGEGLLHKAYASAETVNEYRHAYLRHNCNSDSTAAAKIVDGVGKRRYCPVEQSFDCRLICVSLTGFTYPGALYNNDHFMSFALLRAQREAMVPRCTGRYRTKPSHFKDYTFGWCSGRLNAAISKCDKKEQVCGLGRSGCTTCVGKKEILFAFNALRVSSEDLLQPQMVKSLVAFHHATIADMEWLSGNIPQSQQVLEEARSRMSNYDPTQS